MKNLEHFKRQITAENLCDFISCDKCPLHPKYKLGAKKPCFDKLKEWAKEEYKK